MSRVMSGARSLIRVSVAGAVLGIILGTAVGMSSGFLGGRRDEVIMRIMDGLMSFPSLLIALLVLNSLGPSGVNIAGTIGVVFVAPVSRVMRSVTLSVKSLEFVESARLRGEPTAYITFREILPNAVPVLAVEASVRFSYAILLVASLGFLGLGVQPPSPDWGLMISESRRFIVAAPWVAIAPADGRGHTGHRRQSPCRRHQASPRAAREGSVTVNNETHETNGNAPLLEIEHLSVTFHTPRATVYAVRDASLKIGRGELVGVVGESGCGKSTTAFAIMGYLPGTATVEGSILFEGQDINQIGANELRRLRGNRIAMVYQDPSTSLNPTMRIGAQMDEALREHQDLSRAGARERTVELFASVGLSEPEKIGDRYPHQLSGGMQQRVVIAMALACDPDLLIMDRAHHGARRHY